MEQGRKAKVGRWRSTSHGLNGLSRICACQRISWKDRHSCLSSSSERIARPAADGTSILASHDEAVQKEPNGCHGPYRGTKHHGRDKHSCLSSSVCPHRQTGMPGLPLAGYTFLVVLMVKYECLTHRVRSTFACCIGQSTISGLRPYKGPQNDFHN